MDKQPAELMDQQVALRIRARRIDQGITLQALARQIGVAFQQAHKYERGLSRISAGRLYHVACALSVPIGFFCRFNGGDASTREADGKARPGGPAHGPAGSIWQLRRPRQDAAGLCGRQAMESRG